MNLGPTTAVLVALALCQSATAQVNAPDEARVYLLNRCFISEPLPPAPPPDRFALAPLGMGLLSNAIPAVVGALYSGVVSALKKAGDPKDLTALAPPAPFYLYPASNESKGATPKPQLGCIVLAYGKFAPGSSLMPPELASPRGNCDDACAAAKPADVAKCQKCVDASLPDQANDLALVFEASLTASEDAGSFFYSARHLQIRRWMEKGRESRPHSYTSTFSLEAPGAKADDKVLSIGILHLGERKMGVIYGADELAAHTGWLTGFGLDDDGKAALKKLAEADKPMKVRLSPLTLQASITESAEGSKFAAQLASILDSMKSDAVKTITASLDPAQIKKSKEEAASALETARQAEEKSFADYLDARIANAKVPDDPNADTATKLAKQKLVVAEATTKRAWCRDQKALTLLSSDTPPDRGVTCP